jgi:hypothetical protein
MEYRIIIVTFHAQLNEISACFGSFSTPQFHGHIAHGSMQNDFATAIKKKLVDPFGTRWIFGSISVPWVRLLYVDVGHGRW